MPEFSQLEKRGVHTGPCEVCGLMETVWGSGAPHWLCFEIFDEVFATSEEETLFVVPWPGMSSTAARESAVKFVNSHFEGRFSAEMCSVSISGMTSATQYGGMAIRRVNTQ